MTRAMTYSSDEADDTASAFHLHALLGSADTGHGDNPRHTRDRHDASLNPFGVKNPAECDVLATPTGAVGEHPHGPAEGGIEHPYEGDEIENADGDQDGDGDEEGDQDGKAESDRPGGRLKSDTGAVRGGGGFMGTRLSPSSVAVALLALAGAAGVLLMARRVGPGNALAAESDANRAVKSFITQGPGDLKRIEATLRDTQKVVDRFGTFPNSQQVPLASLRTNPFKSADPAPADFGTAPARPDTGRATALNDVARLQLQSVMVGGGGRTCMVNNHFCREGQDIDGFIIESIAANSVIVKRGVYRFDLRLQP